jgi:hypothetical protein
VQSLPLKFDLKVNCPVVKSIIFSKPEITQNFIVILLVIVITAGQS